MKVPTLDWTLNIGTLSAFATVVAGGLVAYAEFVSSTQLTKDRIDAVQLAMVEYQRATQARTDKYVPMIEENQRSNELQNQRFQNMVNSMADLRGLIQDESRNISEMVKSVSQQHEDIAIMKVQFLHQSQVQDRQDSQKR